MAHSEFIASVSSTEQAEWILQNTGGTVHNTVENARKLLFAKVSFESNAELALYLLTWPDNRQY